MTTTHFSLTLDDLDLEHCSEAPLRYVAQKQETEVTIEGEVSLGRPAYTTGPIDKCYPAEDPEVHTWEAFIQRPPFPVLQIEEHDLTPTAVDCLIEQLIIAAAIERSEPPEQPILGEG